ncbi:MAG: Verru_Chthon cassette protein A [Verrucomicrobiae bacterium]
MKTIFLHRSSRGIALVVVLAFLVILLGLAVTFLTRTSLERSASASFAASSGTRQLADAAVNLAQAQIKSATNLGGNVAWASQPGMIRTFGSGSSGSYTAGASPLLNFKLYSATDMVTSSGNFTGDIPSAAWSSDKAIWTDLNAPVKTPDPSIPGASLPIYPILDPGALGKVEGFSLTAAPGATTDQPAPMPVRWLYVLQDGTVTAPTGGSGTDSSWTGAPAALIPSKDNSIVGRIAFWTDDETSKVNINTASEGGYWDTPRASPRSERILATSQPLQREWQRYPGHPATTSLLPVLEKLDPGLTRTQIYSLVPRIVGGGSMTDAADPINTVGTGTVYTPLTADTDRLFARTDELLFKPSHDLNTAGLTKSQIDQSRFFLTASSRAPEVNSFNLPRIACWPVYKLKPDGTPDSSRTTAFDRLIAFCSTINGSPYFFQRENPASPTNDISIARNSKLYSYLQKLTVDPAPGFGGDYSTKYGLDRNQILTEIFDYIRSTNLQDDIVATPFTAKGATSGTPPQTTPVAGSGWVVPTYQAGTDTMGFGRAITLSELAIGFICNAAADDPATPLPTDESAGSNTTTNPMIGGNGTVLPAGQRMIQALVVPEFYSVMQGWAALNPDMQVAISGLGSLKLNTLDLFPSDSVTLDYTTQVGDGVHSRGFGGGIWWRYFTKALNTGSGSGASLLVSNPIRLTPDAQGKMAFTGGPLTIEFKSKSTGQTYQTITVNLPGTTLPVPKIVDAGTAAGSISSATTKEQWWLFKQVGSSKPWSEERIVNASRAPGYSTAREQGAVFREKYDVVRSVVLRHGDYRAVAARKTISDPTNTLYIKHPRYDTDDFTACLLTHPNYSRYDLAANDGTALDTNRRYFANIVPSTGTLPDIPPNAVAGDRPEASGDFDSGLPGSQDGAYVNKPDEGNTYVLSTGTSKIPYFDNNDLQTAFGNTFFSPNRIMPSPGMFGSLPTGIKRNKPWETLLFRPQANHPNFSTTIPDHLLMDLFWMPVVEPYAISEPFSTAGKVNMNYQILPFTYIERSTAIRAVFHPERLAAIPDTIVNPFQGNASKEGTENHKTASDATILGTNTRLEIDVNTPASATKKDTEIETLNQFAQKFSAGSIFRSASEICDLQIVPTGGTVADMADTAGGFWSRNRLTGDNLRERIYTTLYPRLTTKSNVFTVHYRVQSLKQVSTGRTATTGWDAWDDAKDKTTGEFRGSTTIERFVSPNDKDIPDYPTDLGRITADPLSNYYKWRVVSTRQFAP